jgi:prepilin-type N-terminal cleavage/methylation domain-containing protein
MYTYANEKGFTLLEVLAAIAIFSVALLLFNAYFVNSFSSAKRQDSQLVAMNIARQIAEQWRTGQGEITIGGETIHSSYNEIAAKETEVLVDTDSDGVNDEHALSDIILNGITYSPTITIEKLDPLYTVKVTVRKKGDISILATLHTAIANPKKGE